VGLSTAATEVMQTAITMHYLGSRGRRNTALLDRE
jgi:hypothetical protein